jgi:hypothetical protein
LINRGARTGVRVRVAVVRAAVVAVAAFRAGTITIDHRGTAAGETGVAVTVSAGPSHVVAIAVTGAAVVAAGGWEGEASCYRQRESKKSVIFHGGPEVGEKGEWKGER